MAECGGLLNHPGLFRFSHFNHLQSGNDHLSRANMLSFGCECSPLCSPNICSTVIEFEVNVSRGER